VEEEARKGNERTQGQEKEKGEAEGNKQWGSGAVGQMRTQMRSERTKQSLKRTSDGCGRSFQWTISQPNT
jgi:hypothetical protein